MVAISENQAAWILAPKDKTLDVGPGPDQTQPLPDEVVVKVAYVAINPSEWKFQDRAYIDLKYPHVLGSDAAGEVVQVGSDVTRFKPGDRVLGYGTNFVHGAKAGAFQNYVSFREIVVSHIPDSLPFANAAVLPISIITAAAALYDNLKLDLPKFNPEPKGKTVLIWGGSSSVGLSAIQLAKASGYTVATTASSHNHSLVKELGASHIFDHSDPDVVQKIVDTVGQNLVGVIDAITVPAATKACAEVLSRIGGGVLPVVDYQQESLPANVETVIVWCTNPAVGKPEIGRAIFGEYIPQALQNGSFIAKPDPFIVKGGLSKIQEAINLHRKGVSAKKIVVEI